MLLQATQYMTRSLVDYDEFFSTRLSFNIKIVNLLTSARLYVDQLGHHVREILPETSTIKEDIKILFNQEYDTIPEYRFMEALRNYVQHRGIPVHSTQYSASREGEGEDSRLVFSTEVYSNKKYLMEDGHFKRPILKEIPEKVDLKAATRVYVESLSRVHCRTRKIIDQKLKESRLIINKHINQYKQACPGDVIGLHAFCFNGDEFIESISLNTEWDDIRVKLQKRNVELVNLRKRHVTGKANSQNQ